MFIWSSPNRRLADYCLERVELCQDGIQIKSHAEIASDCLLFDQLSPVGERDRYWKLDAQPLDRNSQLKLADSDVAFGFWHYRAGEAGSVLEQALILRACRQHKRAALRDITQRQIKLPGELKVSYATDINRRSLTK